MSPLLLVKADTLDVDLSKAKYKRRWRGPDGKYRYAYEEEHGRPTTPQEGGGFKTTDMAKWLNMQPGLKVTKVTHNAIQLEGFVTIGFTPIKGGQAVTLFDTFATGRPGLYQTRTMHDIDPYHAVAVSLDWMVDDLRSGRAERLRAEGYNMGPAAYRSWRATSYEMSA